MRSTFPHSPLSSLLDGTFTLVVGAGCRFLHTNAIMTGRTFPAGAIQPLHRRRRLNHEPRVYLRRWGRVFSLDHYRATRLYNYWRAPGNAYISTKTHYSST